MHLLPHSRVWYNLYQMKSKLSKSEQGKLILRFCQALTQIKKPEEAAAFLTDLLSESEIEMVSKRLKIAEKLIEGKRYEEIIDDLKVGYGTVARVSEWLRISGEGYRTILFRLDEIREIETIPVRKSEMERRYPMHYWPQILLKEIISAASKRQKEKLQRVLSQLPEKSRLNKDLSREINILLHSQKY